jgi:hypothetical protein
MGEINKYIFSGYDSMWRESTVRIHTHIKIKNNNNNSINSYLFVC